MMQERGVSVDHSTLNRWVIKYAPEFQQQFRHRQQPVGKSWRLDETYVKIKGNGPSCTAPSTKRATPLIFC
jgi:transposase-like protein